jgi:hypothetical protein
MSAELARFERELLASPALSWRVLRKLPSAPTERERIIRCCPQTVDVASARALAKAIVLGELWRIEISE